jgi:hypothetical protein
MDMSDQLHASVVSPPGKETTVPIGYEVWWAPEPVWKLWSREKYLAPAGNLTRPFSPQTVAIPTEQFRLMDAETDIINYSTNIVLSQTGYNQRTHLHSQYRYANIRKTHTSIILGKRWCHSWASLMKSGGTAPSILTSASLPIRITLGTHCRRGWVGPSRKNPCPYWKLNPDPSASQLVA